MNTFRLARPLDHRDDNDAVVAAYGRILRKQLLSIAEAPAPGAVVLSVMQAMQDTAAHLFEAAFLRGKKQAVGYPTGLTITDRLWIDTKLASNRHYLTTSLQPDIIAKINRQRLDLPLNTGARIAAIDGSFGARVENLYGGVLWTAHEAGFRAGCHHLHEVAQDRSALIQDDWVSEDTPPEDTQSQPAQQKKKDRWLLLLWVSRSTGIPASELTLVRLHFGTLYATQQDARVCAPCGGAAGEYFFPDESPLPGEVCVGMGNCRCWIEIIVGVVQ